MGNIFRSTGLDLAFDNAAAKNKVVSLGEFLSIQRRLSGMDIDPESSFSLVAKDPPISDTLKDFIKGELEEASADGSLGFYRKPIDLSKFPDSFNKDGWESLTYVNTAALKLYTPRFDRSYFSFVGGKFKKKSKITDKALVTASIAAFVKCKNYKYMLETGWLQPTALLQPYIPLPLRTEEDETHGGYDCKGLNRKLTI